MALLAVPQIERRALRDEEQLRVLLASLHFRVHAGQRRLEVVRDVLVELVVLLVGDRRLRPGPERRRLVDLFVLVGGDLLLGLRVPRFLLHENGHGDVIGVLAQDLAQSPAREQFVFVRPQVQDDVGPPRRLLDGLDRVLALAGALPLDAVVGRRAGAPGQQCDAVGDDEGGVEADTELPDQVGVLGPVRGELLEELARAGLGDRADLLDHFLPRHADAAVGDGNRPRRDIDADADPDVVIVLEERGVGDRLEPQLVGGI